MKKRSSSGGEKARTSRLGPGRRIPGGMSTSCVRSAEWRGGPTASPLSRSAQKVSIPNSWRESDGAAPDRFSRGEPAGTMNSAEQLPISPAARNASCATPGTRAAMSIGVGASPNPDAFNVEHRHNTPSDVRRERTVAVLSRTTGLVDASAEPTAAATTAACASAAGSPRWLKAAAAPSRLSDARSIRPAIVAHARARAGSAGVGPLSALVSSRMARSIGWPTAGPNRYFLACRRMASRPAVPQLHTTPLTTQHRPPAHQPI
eukprot:scaffold4150_cov138-Isochrysis_galbana.AAC.1